MCENNEHSVETHAVRDVLENSPVLASDLLGYCGIGAVAERVRKDADTADRGGCVADVGVAVV